MKASQLSYIVILLCLIYITSAQDEESLIAELQLADLELQDDCENLAHVYKSSLLTNKYNDWIDAQKEHASLLKSESNTLQMYEYIPFYVDRNWTMLVKSGDSLLVDEDWNTLVSYYVGSEELMRTTKVRCADQYENCPIIKSVYEDILQSRRNETVLKKSWNAWQTLLSLRKKDFPKVLNLVNKAASQNDRSDAKSYWEMLVDLEDAYEKADALWEEIQPLYLKLQNFVKTRIFKFYGIRDNMTEIPVYLLGSNYGYDWSYIAELVLPHPQIQYDAKTYLKKMSIEDIYVLAENLTKELGLGTLGDNFWGQSVFNTTICENHVITFCSQEHSELLTCNKTSWTSYLDAFETAVDIALRNTNYVTLPRSWLRSSVIDEAVKSLGSVLAITNMRFYGVVDEELFLSTEQNDPNKMTELLLVALRVLPKLPFYLAADKWRLHVLENGFVNTGKTWWKYRRDLQRVRGIFNNETDFLGDPYIMFNKPYISKFFGIILQFQLLQYYTLQMPDLQENMASYIGKDETYLSFIHDRLSDEWQNLITNNYGISELTGMALLDYFQPLENYLDTAPLEQQPFTTESPIPTTKNLLLDNIDSEEKINASNTVSITVETEDTPKPHETIKRSSNENKDKLIMYIGVGLLIAVTGLVMGTRIAKRKRINKNRRFET